MNESSNSFRSLFQQNPTNTILRGDSDFADTKYLDLIPEPQENIYSVVHIDKNFKYPNEFNGRNIWRGLLSPIVNQMGCGSCWAFAAVCVLADRFNIHSKGTLNLQLSPVPIVLCNIHGGERPKPLRNLEQSIKIFESVQKLFGCKGNLLSEAWRMLYTVGTNDTKCMPLDILKYTTPSSCIKLTGPTGDMCSDYFYNTSNNIEYGTPAKFYTAKHIYAIPNSEVNICQEIFKFGPISTAMEIYKDFYLFNPKTTIYRSNFEGGRISGHAVVIDGWGEENGVKYWWIRNSWGKEWGIDGYFKMIRGENHCKIEENCIACIPDLKNAFFNLDEFDISSVPEILRNKFYIHTYSNIAGGLDSETGYSRRIISYLDNKKDLLFTKGNAPDYTSFIAGEILKPISTSSQPISYTQTKQHDIIIPSTNTTNIYLYIVFVVVLLIISVAIIIYKKF